MNLHKLYFPNKGSTELTIWTITDIKLQQLINSLLFVGQKGHSKIRYALGRNWPEDLQPPSHETDFPSLVTYCYVQLLKTGKKYIFLLSILTHTEQSIHEREFH